MERIEKRMGKMKKGKWLCQNDDKDEEEEEEEKDELVDDSEEDEKKAPTKGKFVAKGVKKEVNASLDWDPFGEEEEL